MGRYDPEGNDRQHNPTTTNWKFSFPDSIEKEKESETKHSCHF
jgi:hypothetical protein